MADTCDLAHGHAEYAGIVYLEGCDVGAVRVAGFGRGQVARPHPEAAHHENGQDHPYDTQRIGHRAAQRRSVGGNSQLVERLLRRTQRRRVGRRAAQYAHHFGERYGGDATQEDRHAGADCYDAESQQVESHAAPVERTEKARSHLQSERVDEEHQSEAFGIFEHLFVDRQPEVTGQNSHEEDERDAQRDAADAHLAQCHACGADQGDDDHRLQRRMFHEKGIDPLHACSAR